MGTKNNPGEYDCHSRAEPDEPYFTLLGRDPVASIVVDYWAFLRETEGKIEGAKLVEARRCAKAMSDWAVAKGKADRIKHIEDLIPNRLQAILEENERLRTENKRLVAENTKATEMLSSIRKVVGEEPLEIER